MDERHESPGPQGSGHPVTKSPPQCLPAGTEAGFGDLVVLFGLRRRGGAGSAAEPTIRVPFPVAAHARSAKAAAAAAPVTAVSAAARSASAVLAGPHAGWIERLVQPDGGEVDASLA